ncbi:MAG: NAD(P)-dependent oxidoreductase [Aggregatilineales bacterium]
MKVLVTGANGLIGKDAVRQLLEQGYDVRAIDINEESAHPDVEYAMCDVRDFDAVREQVRGCDSVIHLAALPSPIYATGSVTFHINVTGTYNVYEAAAQEGIKRITQASSVNAIGVTWTVGEFVPDHFPIDETQSQQTTDPYSLSKQLSEDIGAYFWRRDKISSTAIRLPAVFPAEFFKSEDYYAMRDTAAGYIDEFLKIPEDEWKRLLVKVRKHTLAFRAERALEFGTKKEKPPEDQVDGITHNLWDAYLWHRNMLWGLVDVRDTVQAFIKSLTADFKGSQPLFINDTGNFAEYDAKTLVRLFFPDVAILEGQLEGKASLISIKKAQHLLGFEPQYSVRET